MPAISMTRIDASRNMARFYEIDVQPTLFGDFSVQRHWGRIGTAGSSKSFWYPSETLADANACAVEHAKRKKGYSGS